MAKRKYKKKKKLKQLRIGGWTILSIIGAVMLLISLPLLKKGRHAEYGAKIPHRAFCYGIDISHYQKEIQWDSLRILTDGAGRTIRSKSHAKDIRPVSFVFIKATEGTSMKDRHFKMHWKSAKENGIGVIIAGAGGAAHVAGVVAGMTTVPVIGVPIQTKALGGMDSLLSIVQMPAGIPVATMAINGAKNAGLFAAQILALTDPELSAKLDAFRKEQTQKVLDATI